EAALQITALSAGVHTLNLWMREDGLSIDRIVVSMDRNFDISLPDIGPVETACIPNNPPSETAIAWDMVNSTSSNLISFSTDAAAFLSPADCFGKAQREVSTTIPFGVLDDSLTIFPDDDQGIIGESNTEEFFCIVDTINDQNQGVLSAEWQFNITGATDLSLSLDAGAMGNFETTDQFQWAYQIDGNPAVTFLSSTVDLEQENTYILDDGDAFTLEDVMLANGVLLDNHLQTFTEVISGTGSIMTLVLSATVNADIDAIAFQNLIINGTGMVVDPPPPPPPPMLGLQITEIMYNPASLEPDWEWIEVYNTGNVSVDLAGAVLDDGDAVTVSASNIAEGVIEPGQAGILYNTDLIAGPDFEAAWGDVNLIAVTEWENINLNNDGDTIALWLSFAAYDGDVQTQANAITAVTYDVGGEWPIGTGFASIYLTDLDADPSNPLNWSLSEAGVETPVSTAFVSNFAGGNGGLDIGSPAPSAIEPLAASLLITEIMYNPAAPEPDWEWVEVYNSGNVMLDLAGYVIDDNNSVTMELANIGPGMLGPGESAVLYNADAVTAEDFAAAWGTVNLIPVTNWGDMSLDNSGDTVSIWDSTDAYFADLADETEATQPFATVAFDDSGDWPEDNDFASIYLTALDADPALGASWATSVDGIATPVNDTYTSTISAENVGQDLGSPGIPAP
ncbi:MAG: lamin tail domain-containing protein, partial [Chloroflexota bacterium]